jgi:hypothetical protein
VDPNILRLPLPPPLPAGILEIPDQLLHLGVDGDDRLLLGQRSLRHLVDATKLRIPIGVALPRAGLAVALQAEVQPFQQLPDHRVADRMTLGTQFRGKPTQALARPAQRRLRIAAFGRLDQGQQRLDQAAIVFRERLAV